MSETISVTLTPDELLVLDGHTTNEQIIKHIERIKTERSLQSIAGTDATGAFIAKVLALGLSKGRIGYGWRSGKCQVCQKPGFVERYRGGRYKGSPKRTHWYQVLDFEDATVFVDNHTPYGVCRECLEEVQPRLAAIITEHSDLCRFEWPEQIAPKKWQKSYRYHCSKCDKDSWEHELRLLPAVMGGTYRGGCPHCDGENVWPGPTVLKRDYKTWRVFPVKEARS